MSKNRRAMATAAAAVVAAAIMTACEDMTPKVPDVAGHYEGPVVIRFTDLGVEASGSVLIRVVQAGAEVTISGSITIGGTTAEIAAITGEVNATGNVRVTQSGVTGTSADDTCGVYRPVSSSLTFEGNVARLVENVDTTLCGAVHLSGTLTRRSG